VEGRVGMERGEDEKYTAREDLGINELGELDLDDTRLTLVEGSTEKWRASVMVRWDLSGVVFNSEELAVSAEIGRQRRARDALMATVTQLYFERRRRQIQRLLTPPVTRLEAAELALEIDALTARLDGLTGGWFSEAVVEGMLLRTDRRRSEAASSPTPDEAQSPH
jgi:hypothetical protein